MSKYPDNPCWDQHNDAPLTLYTQQNWDEADEAGHITGEHVLQRLWRMLMSEYGNETAAAYDSDGFFLSLTAAGIPLEGGVKLYVYPNDHQPPHAHVKLKGDGKVNVRISLETGEVISSDTKINSKTLKKWKDLVVERHSDLAEMWFKYQGETVALGELPQ